MLNIPALLFSCAAWCLLWLILLAICVRHFPWAIAHDYPRDMQDCAALPAPSNAQKKTQHNICCAEFCLAIRIRADIGVARLRLAQRAVCHRVVPPLADRHGVECGGFAAGGLAADLHARFAVVYSPQ